MSKKNAINVDEIIANKWLVEINRKPLDKHPLFGFMLAYEDEFTIIQEFDQKMFCLDGFVVFRNDSVKNFIVYDKPDYFLSEVIEFEQIKPLPMPDITLSSWPDIIESVSKLFPLLVIKQEAIDRSVCYVGKLIETKKKGYSLRDIDPGAEWEKKRSYKFKDLTMLQFGGRYESVLATVNQKREALKIN